MNKRTTHSDCVAFMFSEKLFWKNLLRRFCDPLHWKMESKFFPHLGAIIEWRRQGLSYRACCAELARSGVMTGPGNLYRWLKRQRRRAQRIAREVAPFNVLLGEGGGEVKPMLAGRRFELNDYEGEITK